MVLAFFFKVTRKSMKITPMYRRPFQIFHNNRMGIRKRFQTKYHRPKNLDLRCAIALRNIFANIFREKNPPTFESRIAFQLGTLEFKKKKKFYTTMDRCCFENKTILYNLSNRVPIDWRPRPYQ